MRWLMLLLLLVGLGSAETVYYSWGSEEIHADGTRTPIWGHPTYLSWDGSWHSKSDLNFQDGRWSYYVEDYTTSWKVTTRNGTFRLPQRSWIEYDFGLFEIKETLHIPALQALVDRSVVHNASVRYIPLPWSPSVVFSQVGNALSLGDWRTGDFWIRDNKSYTNENVTFANYSYYNVEDHYQLKVVNGEIRLYFDDLAWFQNAVYPLVIDPTWITNSGSGWNGELDQTVEYGNGRIKLNHNQTGLVSWWDNSENTGVTSYDYTTNNNDGTLTNMEEADWVTGKYGYGLNFDGVNEYVDAGNDFLTFIPNRIARDGTRTYRRLGSAGLYDTTSDKTFITWMGVSGHPFIKEYDHNTEAWSNAVQVAATPFLDAHNYPMLIMDSAGYLHIFHGGHNTVQKHSVSNTSRSVGTSISDWTDGNITEAVLSSYPFPIVATNGDIYLFYRETTGGGASIHRPLKMTKSTDNGTIWSAATPAIEIYRADDLEEIYVGKTKHEEAHDAIPEKMHFTWMIGGGASHDNKHRNTYYAYFKPSDNHWYNVEDTDLGTHLNDTESDTYCTVNNSGTPTLHDVGYIPLVDVFNDGKPAIIWGDNTTLKFRYAGWNGTNWNTYNITDYAHENRNSGDMEIEGTTVRFIVPRDDGIQYYKSANSGETWALERTIASPLDSSLESKSISGTEFIKDGFNNTRLTFRTHTDLTGQNIYASDIDTTFNTDGRELTITAWVKLSSKGQDRAIIADGASQGKFMLWYDIGNDCFATSVRPGASSNSMDNNPTTPSLDTWYHIAVTYTNTTHSLYIDGVLENSQASTGNPINLAGNIGIGWWYSGNTRHWNGTIDEPMLYNYALTPEEINTTMDGQTRYLTGNYTSPDYDCGSGNIAKNISVHFINSSGNTNMNIYVNMSTDNSTWDSSYTLVQAGALNGTEYDITSGKRYIKYRTQLNTTTGAETDEMYEVRVECVTGDTTAPSWDELPTNQIAEYGTAFEIVFNATDATTPPVIYTVNDTDFAMGSASGILTNNTYLSIGVYYLQLNASDSVSPANINSTDITVTVSDTTDPTVTWYNQTNSTGDEVDIDINTRRLLNLTWNLTDSSPINISSCSIQIRINDTTINSTDWLFENDTLSSNLNANGWWTHPCTLAYNNSDNTSISIYAELPNTLYYRATSLAIPISDIADDVTYTIFRDKVAMFKNSNATIEANYNYITKHYLDSKEQTQADARLWYCNSTYATGGWGDYRTNENCIIGASIHENETKEGGSNYFERFGSADENATFGGVKITDPSYFITDSVDASSATLGWELTGTSGHSGHSYTSDDYGVTWTLETDMEFDIIIQWINAMYFEARINITDTEGNNVVDFQSDYFDTVNRAPEAAFKKDCDAGGLLTVYNECNISELGTLNISADFLDPDADLVNCTFILLNNDSSYNQTLQEIETNTSYGVCSFQYDTTAITNGDYYFKVNVTDGLLTGSDSTYDFVRIENPSPQPAPTLTNHTCTPGTFTLEITATYNASAHNVSLNYGNTTALGTILWNTTTGTSFTFNPTSLDQNTTYYYNFTSYNSTGDFLVNGTYNCTTNPYTPPTWTQDNAINIWLLILLLTLAMTLHLLGILIESSTINFTAYSLFLLIGLAIMAAGIQIESGETATVVGDITTKIATFSIINTIFINSYGITILLYGLYGMITAYTGRKLEDDDEDREFNRQEEYFNERT